MWKSTLQKTTIKSLRLLSQKLRNNQGTGVEELISCVHCQATLLLFFLTDSELLPICASSFSASSAAFLSCDEIRHYNFQMGSHGRTQMSMCLVIWRFILRSL